MQNNFDWAYGKVNVEGSINYYFQRNIENAGKPDWFDKTEDILNDFPDENLKSFPVYSIIHGGGYDFSIAQGNILDGDEQGNRNIGKRFMGEVDISCWSCTRGATANLKARPSLRSGAIIAPTNTTPPGNVFSYEYSSFVNGMFHITIS